MKKTVKFILWVKELMDNIKTKIINPAPSP